MCDGRMGGVSRLIITGSQVFIKKSLLGMPLILICGNPWNIGIGSYDLDYASVSIRIKAAIALLLMTCLSAFRTNATEAGDASVRHAIVVATVSKVRYVQDLEPAYPGDIPLGSIFEVKISRPQVVRGDFPEDVRELRLTATHKEVLELRKRIAIFVEIRQDEISAVTWADVFSATCFDDELWSASELKEQWDYAEKSRLRSDARSCVYLDD